jgi:iron complex transport system substrate-binding protein
MKTHLAGVLLLLCIVLCGCTSVPDQVMGNQTLNNQHSTTVVITDSLNETSSINVPVQRLVVNHADAIEMLFALGAGDTIIGVPDSSLTDPDFKGHLKNARGIGDWTLPNPEVILTLKPDVMIIMTSKTNNIDILNSQNLTILYLDCFKLDTLPAEAKLLGTITSKKTKAQEYIDFVEKYQNLVYSRIDASPKIHRPTIYAEKYADFSPEAEESGVDQMIGRLQANNIAHDVSGNVKVSPEWVVDHNPEIILRFESNSYLERGGTFKEKYDAMFNRTGFDMIDAIRNKRVYVLQSDMFYSPRAVVGLVYLAKILYPEEFTDIDPDTIVKEYEDKFFPVSYKSTISYPSL